MAGEWIKFESSTLEKPEVWAISQSLNIDPDAVIGKLLHVWIWFDQHTEEGNAPSVTKMLLDRKVGVIGFCDAVISAGWMIEIEDEANPAATIIQLPNFDRHNGKTAKKRASTAKRVANHKAKVTQQSEKGNAASVSGALPKEEKRREEKNNNKTLDQSAIDQCFESFWSAGMRKINKKKTQPLFEKIITKHAKPDGPTVFDLTAQLVADIHNRLSAGQLGFAEMHPTTYLNGERWNDEIPTPQQQSATEQPRSASERVRAAVSAKAANRDRAGSAGGGFGGQAVADDGGHVRPQVCESVRGNTAGHLGEVLEGDFRPANC